MNKGTFQNAHLLGFTTPDQAVVANSATLTVAHPFQRAPARIRWVLVNKKAEFGYLPGDEVDLAFTRDSGGSGSNFSAYANAQNLFLVRNTSGNINVCRADTNGFGGIAVASWVLKGYAYLI